MEAGWAPGQGVSWRVGWVAGGGWRGISEKNGFNFFEFDNIAYLCLPKKNSRSVRCEGLVLRSWDGVLPVRADIVSQAEVAQLVEQLICNQ